MSISALRNQLRDGLLDFAWGEWSQMGVFASRDRRSPWAADPEAFIVFSLEVARDDPRLFDELLDWLLVNESLLSVRRLRSLCGDDDDRRLVDAVLAWLGTQRSSARLRRPAPQRRGRELLFRGLARPAAIDESFASQGLIRAPVERSRKSERPDVGSPINFAFRLRHLLGVGARAEVIRFLLTADTPTANAQAITRSACFAKRNVHDALAALANAGAVESWTVGPEQRYAVSKPRWAAFFDLLPEELPRFRDWPAALRVLRRLLRFTQRSDLADLSEYLMASRARDLLEELRSDLLRCDIALPPRTTAAGAVDDLVVAATAGLDFLTPLGGAIPTSDASVRVVPEGNGFVWTLRAPNRAEVARSDAFSTASAAARAASELRARANRWRYEVYREAAGSWRWRAIAPNGRVVASSSESFSAMAGAERASRYARTLAVATAPIVVLADDTSE
jgi:uncharacterized protein YegP (UPF0339 family)